MAEPPVGLRAVFAGGPSNINPTRVVIHSTAPGVGYPRASADGMALGTARYFASGRAGGSAHYVEDLSDEQHCVPDVNIAYHAPPNERSIGIEICSEATYTRDQWLSDQVWPAVAKAADRTRELCARFGIPVVKINPTDLLAGAHGICGHVDVSQAWRQSTHTDPGPDFPWPEFLAAVLGGQASGKEPELMRFVNLENVAGDTPDHSAVLTIDGVGNSIVMPAGARAWVQWSAFFPYVNGSIAPAGDTTTTARCEWMVFNVKGVAKPVAPFNLKHRSGGAMELPPGTTSVEVVVRGLPKGGAVAFHVDGIGHA